MPNASSLKIAFDGDLIYAAYCYPDALDNYKKMVAVKVYNGNNWNDVGEPITLNRINSIELAIDNHRPYIAMEFREVNSDHIIAKRLEGSVWQEFGSEVYSSSSIAEAAFLLNGNVSYAAYTDNFGANQGLIRLKKFDFTGYDPDPEYNSAEGWININNTGIFGGTSTNVQIVNNQGITYLTYIKSNNGIDKLTVQKYDSNTAQWVNVGNANISDGTKGSKNFLVFDENTPYVVYEDGDANIRSVFVKKFNGTNWEAMNQEGLPLQRVFNISMAFLNHEAMVSYSDASNFIFIKKYTLDQLLPVSLSKFEASKNAFGEALLNWETASESNNDYFILEKSQDAKSFKLFDQIKSKGNSNNSKNYQAIDKNPFIGQAYYRLSQTDINGKRKELGIKSVLVNELNADFSVYPNPVYQQVFNLNIAGLEGDKEMLLYDFLGKEILKQRIVFENGKASVVLNQNLAKGIYLLNVSGTMLKIKLVVE